jgi:hypothetical protein
LTSISLYYIVGVNKTQKKGYVMAKGNKILKTRHLQSSCTTAQGEIMDKVLRKTSYTESLLIRKILMEYCEEYLLGETE